MVKFSENGVEDTNKSPTAKKKKTSKIKKGIFALDRRLYKVYERIRKYARLHPKRTLASCALVLAFIFSSAHFYNLGKKSSVAGVAKVAVSAADKSKSSESPSGTNAKALNSGFLRLSGTVQSVSKNELSIKVDSGSIFTFSLKPESKYFESGKASRPASELKSGSSVVVVGSVEPNGVLAISNIQMQK